MSGAKARRRTAKRKADTVDRAQIRSVLWSSSMALLAHVRAAFDDVGVERVVVVLRRRPKSPPAS